MTDDELERAIVERIARARLGGWRRWALDTGHVKTDPTHGIADLALANTTGFPIWTEEHVDKFTSCWPLGTRQRVWLDVLITPTSRCADRDYAAKRQSALLIGPSRLFQ